MKSPLQRRTAFIALLLAPVLAACGFSAQTDQVYQASAGVNDRSTDVYVLNAVVISGADGSGTFAGTLVNTTSTARALANVAGEGIQATPGKDADLAVPAYGALNLGAANATGIVPITISGDGVKPGGFVLLTFTFDNTQKATLRVPVLSQTEDYTTVPLPPVPTTSTTADEPTGDSTDDAGEHASDQTHTE